MTDLPLGHPPGRAHPIPGPATTARDFLFLVLGLPVGIATFTVAVTGLALAAGLAITLAGIPVLLLTLVAMRAAAGLERRRAAALLGITIPSPERRLRGGLWARTRAILTDHASWRDTLWSLLALPAGIAGFAAAVTPWSVALGFLTSPAWAWALSADDPTIPLLDSTAPGYSLLRMLIGLALVPTAAVACRALASGTGRLARALLG